MADRRLQVFHAVAKQLSFSTAADVLFMTQPAVTFRIKQLEGHFNTRLFDRGHGRIALTPAGEVVLGHAEKILGEFKSTYPGVRSRLVVGNSETIEHRVMEHAIDIGFVEFASARLRAPGAKKRAQRLFAQQFRTALK